MVPRLQCWGERTLRSIRLVPNFGAHAAGRRVATPGRVTLTSFLCTQQVIDFGGNAFARWLQHSIQGASSSYPGGSLTR